MRRIALTAATLFTATAGAGCMTVAPSAVSAVAGAGAGFSYVGGRAVQTFAAPPATVQPALLAAMEDLRIQPGSPTVSNGAVFFEGSTADNRRASATLRPHPAGTRLSARFGLFGDEPLSRALMDRVSIRLGALPPSAVPADPPSEPASNPWFSRSAVPDDVMLKDQADAPFRNNPSP